MGARSRSFGRAVLSAPDAKPIEHDTLTCKHCQRVVFVKPGSAQTVYLIWHHRSRHWAEHMGAFCRQCMAPVCLSCEALGRCTPWEKRLEEVEARARLRRSV